VRNLPESQRAALVVSEVGDLDHPQIAEILECEAKKVKALIFQARSSLIASRQAREVSCTEIREQLATARVGALRRTPLRRHLKRCPGCAEFAEDVRRQRAMLAVALPVVPSLGLKESALGAAGIGGGGAAGGGGLLAALGAHAGTKAVVAALAVGGAAGGVVAIDPSVIDKARAAVVRPFGGGAERVSEGSAHADARPDEANASIAGGSARPAGDRRAANGPSRSEGGDEARSNPRGDARRRGAERRRGGSASRGPHGRRGSGRGAGHGRRGGRRRSSRRAHRNTPRGAHRSRGRPTRTAPGRRGLVRSRRGGDRSNRSNPVPVKGRSKDAVEPKVRLPSGSAAP